VGKITSALLGNFTSALTATGAIVFGSVELSAYGAVIDAVTLTPAQVIHPGEPGFLEDEGRFDCGAIG
jgi:hypothetical protein